MNGQLLSATESTYAGESTVFAYHGIIVINRSALEELSADEYTETPQDYPGGSHAYLLIDD